MDIGVPEIFASSLAALAAMGYPANRATDALVADIAASQMADGSWYLVGGIGKPTARRGRLHHAHGAVRAIAESLRPARTRG